MLQIHVGTRFRGSATITMATRPKERDTPKAIVVGGGIAGLSSAIALLRCGWQVEVLEQAPDFSEVGAGLSLWPNALRALAHLDLLDGVLKRAQTQKQAGIRDHKGRWILRTDTTLRGRFGDVVMVHRADLLETLKEALPAACLTSGVAVESVTADGTVVSSQGIDQADLVVGADGIRSAARGSLWGPVQPRPVGYAAWRFVAQLPAGISESGESWGRGERFGYAPLPDGRVYCFAVANAPEGRTSGGHAELVNRFARWHDPIPQLLSAAQESAILYHDIYELPSLESYTRGRVALVGDAAHAMTPNMGQGACQAIEDAVVLAAVCADGRAHLDRYDTLRRPRARMVATQSRRIGSVAQWSSLPAVTLRNALLRATPAGISSKSVARVLDWAP